MITKEDMERMFDSRNILEWEDVMGIKKNLGFSDVLSDSDLILENNWIIQQFRKYVETKKGDLMPQIVLGDYGKMMDKLREMTESVEDKYAKDRQTLVYQKARDWWLASVINLTAMAAAEAAGEDSDWGEIDG